jgi:DNA repair protein RadC
MESRMWGNSHVRFGEREAGIRTAQAVDGVRVSTLRDPTPSKEDVSLTRQLVEGARLLGIRLHDHVIVGNGSGHWVSLAQRGLL